MMMSDVEEIESPTGIIPTFLDKNALQGIIFCKCIDQWCLACAYDQMEDSARVYALGLRKRLSYAFVLLRCIVLTTGIAAGCKSIHAVVSPQDSSTVEGNWKLASMPFGTCGCAWPKLEHERWPRRGAYHDTGSLCQLAHVGSQRPTVEPIVVSN